MNIAETVISKNSCVKYLSMVSFHRILERIKASKVKILIKEQYEVSSKNDRCCGNTKVL